MRVVLLDSSVIYLDVVTEMIPGKSEQLGNNSPQCDLVQMSP